MKRPQATSGKGQLGRGLTIQMGDQDCCRSSQKGEANDHSDDEDEEKAHDSAPARTRSAGAGLAIPEKISRPFSVPIRVQRNPEGGERLDDGEQ
jgi:hypothetical protein